MQFVLILTISGPFLFCPNKYFKFRQNQIISLLQKFCVLLHIAPFSPYDAYPM